MRFRYFALASTLGMLSTPVLADLSDGLVAHYPFDGNAQDASGNGNDGTVNGATLTEDRFGNADSAYSFDGNDDYIHHATSFSTQEKISLSVWVKAYDVQICPEGSGQVIAAHSYDSYAYNYWLSICDKQIRLVTYSDDHSFVEKSNIIVHSNEWYHIAFNAEKGGNAKIFVNGVEVVSGAAGQNFWNDGYHTIGDLRPDRNLLFYGVLDDLRIYNRALSESEIQQLYQGETCGSTAAGIAQCKANPASCGIEVNGVHAAFALSTGILNIPFVDVPDAFGGFTTYSAELTIIPGADPLSFSLSGAAPVQ